MYKVLFLFMSFYFMAPEIQSQSVFTKPKVLILTTGGTIASQSGNPLIEGPALVRAVPELAAIASVEVDEVIRIGSSKMTPAVWLQLLSKLEMWIERVPELACILITHGTDTMEETAFFLDQTFKHDIPIVLVGAMRSANAVSADGPANLLDALRTGLSPEAKGKGVMVVLNNAIHAAVDLTKTDNTRVQTFAPTPKGYLGTVDDAGVHFFRSPYHP
ncbi:MAG: asparaginase, partial [Saprospiraceae bacterium]|nr:asparaginase [Saprospiraceae bacterium]